MANKITPIFIFSLRRCGSTLLQRILAADANISAVGEPHILLPLFYALKDGGMYSEYDHKVTARAIKDFCQHLPGGLDAYFAEIRNTTLALYEKTGMGIFDIS